MATDRAVFIWVRYATAIIHRAAPFDLPWKSTNLGQWTRKHLGIHENFFYCFYLWTIGDHLDWIYLEGIKIPFISFIRLMGDRNLISFSPISVDRNRLGQCHAWHIEFFVFTN